MQTLDEQTKKWHAVWTDGDLGSCAPMLKEDKPRAVPPHVLVQYRSGGVSVAQLRKALVTYSGKKGTGARCH